MKLLVGYHTHEEAAGLQEYLERNGIAVYVEYEGARGSGFQHSVFAALDFQHQDALLLMENPDHIVVHKTDVDEYQAYVSGAEGKARALETMLKGIGLAVLLVVVVAGLITYFVNEY